MRRNTRTVSCELLACKIKSVLVCSLKGDPACHVTMPFDSIHFDGMMRRSVRLQDRVKSFTLTKLTNLDEVLGKRWYIQGINAAGDFSYVKLETLRFYLRKSRSKTDYQWQDNGTLTKYQFGTNLKMIVFKFVRGDETLHNGTVFLIYVLNQLSCNFINVVHLQIVCTSENIMKKTCGYHRYIYMYHK